MPGLDDRLEQALQGAALVPEHDPAAVAAVVAHKRRRRRARRRAASGLAVATVVATALATTVVVVGSSDEPDDVQVATDQTVAPPTTPPPPPLPVQPPADPEAAAAEIAAVAPGSYDVGPVTFIAPDAAVATVTDATGVAYAGVRFERADPGGWAMAPASACRLPGAFGVCADIAPEVLVTAGKVALGPEVYGGTPVGATRHTGDLDQRYLRGPVLAAGRVVVAAAYDRTNDRGAPWTFPPSYVVELASDPSAGAIRVNLEGQILSFADAREVLWAVTRDRVIDADGVEYRLKRIDLATGNHQSIPLPTDAVPAGPVVAGAGGVWVPLRDGVLGFSHSGAEPVRVALPAQPRRVVAVAGSGTYATAGNTVVRIDAGGSQVGEIAFTHAGPEAVTDVVATDTAVWATTGSELLRLSRDLSVVEARDALPTGLIETRLGADANQAWVTGLADLAAPLGESGTGASVAQERVALLLDESGIAATVVLAGAADADFAMVGTGELVVIAGGSAYHVTLPT